MRQKTAGIKPAGTIKSDAQAKGLSLTKRAATIALTFMMAASLCFSSGLTAFAEEAKDAAPDPGAAPQKTEEAVSLSEGIIAVEQSAQQNQTVAEATSVDKLFTGAIDDVLAANASGTPLSKEGDASLQADEGTAAANKTEATEAAPAAPQASPAETDSAIVPLDEDDIRSGVSGTCSWVIDKDGLLTIRPTDGISGTMEKLDGFFSWWHSGEHSITSVVFEKGVKAPEDCSYMFFDMPELASVDLTNLDTSQVTNMSDMFRDCPKLTSVNFSNFKTSNVTDMTRMFCDCSSLPSLDVSGFDTAKVTSMGAMFSRCPSLTSLDVSGFDTAQVMYLNHMFHGCSSLSSLDVSGFDTSQVTNMKEMFHDCPSLTSLDVSGFDTAKVTDMSYMFRDCSSLPSLDVSGFDTAQVMDMSWMFNGCSKLPSLDVSGFDTAQVTDMRNMFSGDEKITFLDLSGFDMSNAVDCGSMLNNCPSLSKLTLGEKTSLTDYVDLTDAPTTEPYTGRWILEGGDMPMTAAELMANYPNAATGYPVGTYVWETGNPVVTHNVTYSVTGEVPEGYAAPTDTKAYAEGDAITVAAVPTAEGYTFDGWKLDGTVVTDATMGAANMMLTGTWTKIPDTVEEPQAQTPVVTKPKTEPAAKTVSASPKTGDELSLIAIALGIASLACAVGVFGLRRRRQQ